MAESIISRDRDSQPLSNFNCKSMARGAISNNDFVLLWWCQWLLQVQFTFVGGGNLVS